MQSFAYLLCYSVISFLEEDAEHEADAVFVGSGVVVVGEAAHVFHVQNLEDIMYAHAQLDVWGVLVHDHGVVLVELCAVLGGAAGEVVALEAEGSIRTAFSSALM